MNNNENTSNFHKSEWYFPKEVRTPNIEEDIGKYLSSVILSEYISCKKQDVKDKIVRVTEMLEFIDHISSISSELKKLDKPTCEFVDGEWYKVSHITYNSHDYSGFDYDCEALVLYLLLSLIDTCVGQAEYKDYVDYIESEFKEDNIAKENVVEKLKQHKELYGLSC